MTKMMTEVELLTQLGSKMGTFCGGLENFRKSHTNEEQNVRSLADVTLQYEDEDFWDYESILDQPREMPPPPLELFDAVLQETYERISYHTTLASQALKELQAWQESLFTREAQQNVGRLEDNAGIEALDPDENFDRTTIRKLGWVDRMMATKGRRKRKGIAPDKAADKKASDLKAQVTGDNAPEKLQIKKKEKPLSFQGTFDKQAIEALQDMLSLVSNPPVAAESVEPNGRTASNIETRKPTPKSNTASSDGSFAKALLEHASSTQPGVAETSAITTTTSNPVSTQASLIPSKPPRARKSRATPAFPFETVEQQCSGSSILKEPLTPMQSNTIGNIRIGSSQAWAMSPNFGKILAAFSAVLTALNARGGVGAGVVDEAFRMGTSIADGARARVLTRAGPASYV
ncbi:unnamed protein product [Calypogeia fissa]